MKKLVFLLRISTLFISSCECVSGLDRDVQKAGKWLEERAK